MLNPPSDVNPVRKLPTKKGGNTDRGKRSFNEVPEPEWEAGNDKNMGNPVMVNGVKGLGCVKEEEKLVLFRLDSFIKVRVNVNNVIGTLLAGQKTFLGGVNEMINGWHDASGHAGGKDPVVRVGDAEGAGVGKKAGELFGEEEEKTMVKAFRGKMAPENSI